MYILLPFIYIIKKYNTLDIIIDLHLEYIYIIFYIINYKGIHMSVCVYTDNHSNKSLMLAKAVKA